MKLFSHFGMLLLWTVATVSYAQSVQITAHSDAHTARIQEEIGKLTQLQARVQAIVLRRQTSQTWTNEAWVNETRTTYDYDGELQTVALTEDWDGDSWENSTRSVTSFSGDQVSSTQFETWNGTSWVPERRSVYTYSGDTFSEILNQSYQNGAWVNEERTTITMSNGALATSVTEIWEGGDWVPQNRFSIQQEGDDVVSLSEEWNGSAWVNADRTVWNDITIAELFDFLEDFETEGDVGFGFSFLLRFPDSVQQEWDGTQWVNVSRQMSERDADDRPVAVQLDTWEEGDWVPGTRYVATYNAEGQLSVVEWQMFAEDWRPFIIQTHSYDSEGLLERIVDQLDFGLGLTNSSQHFFEWTNTSTAVEDDEMPSRIRLAAPYPNPFNPQATIQYHLTSPEHATVRVFDAAGRLVDTLVDGVQPAGEHEVVFDATGLSSGVYMIRLETPSHVESRPVTLLR